MAGSLIVWSIVFSMLVEGGGENAAVAALLVVFYNGFDALLTRHMARKGYMLDSRQSASGMEPQLAAGQA